jgi:hypothetical protein
VSSKEEAAFRGLPFVAYGGAVQRYCVAQRHGEANCYKWRFRIKIRTSTKGNVIFFPKKHIMEGILNLFHGVNKVLL